MRPESQPSALAFPGARGGVRPEPNYVRDSVILHAFEDFRCLHQPCTNDTCAQNTIAFTLCRILSDQKASVV